MRNWLSLQHLNSFNWELECLTTNLSFWKWPTLKFSDPFHIYYTHFFLSFFLVNIFLCYHQLGYIFHFLIGHYWKTLRPLIYLCRWILTPIYLKSMNTSLSQVNILNSKILDAVLIILKKQLATTITITIKFCSTVWSKQ